MLIIIFCSCVQLAGASFSTQLATVWRPLACRRQVEMIWAPKPKGRDLKLSKCEIKTDADKKTCWFFLKVCLHFIHVFIHRLNLSFSRLQIKHLFWWCEAAFQIALWRRMTSRSCSLYQMECARRMFTKDQDGLGALRKKLGDGNHGKPAFFFNKLFFGKQYIYHEYTRYTSMLIGFYQTVPQWVISSIRMIEVFADLRISERCSRICSDDQ